MRFLTMALATTTQPKTKVTPEEKICNEVIKLLEKGVQPWQKKWTTSTSGSYRNFITGHKYSGANVALLTMYECVYNYTSNLYCGFAQARSKGWLVKKGSVASYIMHPKPVKYDKLDKDGNPVKDKDGKPIIVQYMSFQCVPIFNSDCLQGKDAQSQDALEQAIKAEQRNIKENINDIETRKHKCFTVLKDYIDREEIEYREGGDRAYYSPSSDLIGMPAPKQFQDSDSFLATMAHECIHSTKKPSRLDRSFGASRFGNDAYAREELVAELGCLILTRSLNVGSQIENHASYLNSWLSGIKEDRSYLFKSLAYANKAANYIMNPELVGKN